MRTEVGFPSQEGETQSMAQGHPCHPPPLPGGDTASNSRVAKPAWHCLQDCTAGLDVPKLVLDRQRPLPSVPLGDI